MHLAQQACGAPEIWHAKNLVRKKFGTQEIWRIFPK
jgi:hypothetical protein